ncbi:outer membrane beta-barrel protein [Flavobacterium sp. 3HN19-14]|uniref:outer membrane beta-barrel protein n=1 Tax=Flavobacterium sp. 3HN19-14 TaxID=3448133 RepID=UPI003EE042B7
MKKIIFVAMLAIAGFANAQKGTYLVMGSVGFSTNKTDDGANENKSTTFSFAPKVGYQFTDHWTLGLVASYSHNKNETNNVATNESTSNAYSFGVFGRYTQPLTDIFSVYGDLSTSFNSTKTEYDPGSTEYKANGFGIAFTPAVYVNLKNNFGLNFGFGGINYGHSSIDGGSDSSGFNLDFGNSFTMGVSKNF